MTVPLANFTHSWVLPNPLSLRNVGEEKGPLLPRGGSAQAVGRHASPRNRAMAMAMVPPAAASPIRPPEAAALIDSSPSHPSPAVRASPCRRPGPPLAPCGRLPQRRHLRQDRRYRHDCRPGEPRPARRRGHRRLEAGAKGRPGLTSALLPHQSTQYYAYMSTIERSPLLAYRKAYVARRRTAPSHRRSARLTRSC